MACPALCLLSYAVDQPDLAMMQLSDFSTLTVNYTCAGGVAPSSQCQGLSLTAAVSALEDVEQTRD